MGFFFATDYWPRTTDYLGSLLLTTDDWLRTTLLTLESSLLFSRVPVSGAFPDLLSGQQLKYRKLI
jgi:hypothetical protein